MMWMYLVYSLLPITTGCILSGPELTEITVYTGQSALLPCSCSQLQDKPGYVRWTVETVPFKQILKARTSRLEDKYKNRMKMFNGGDTPGNLSLLFSRLTVEDDALYRCKINGSRFRDVRVHVKGCFLSGAERVELKARPGQSVVLPCSCTDPQATPTGLSWNVGSRLVLGEMWSSRSSEWSHVYRHRAAFTNSSPGDLSLLLSNFSEMDEGVYECKVTNNDETEHKLTFLSVTGPPESSRSPPYSHIALLVFFTLPLAVGCYTNISLSRKHKGNPKGLEMTMEPSTVPEDADSSGETTVHIL